MTRAVLGQRPELPSGRRAALRGVGARERLMSDRTSTHILHLSLVSQTAQVRKRDTHGEDNGETDGRNRVTSRYRRGTRAGEPRVLSRADVPPDGDGDQGILALVFRAPVAWWCAPAVAHSPARRDLQRVAGAAPSARGPGRRGARALASSRGAGGHRIRDPRTGERAGGRCRGAGAGCARGRGDGRPRRRLPGGGGAGQGGRTR